MPIVNHTQLELYRNILSVIDGYKNSIAAIKPSHLDEHLQFNFSRMKSTFDDFLHDFALPETYETDDEYHERMKDEAEEEDYRRYTSAIYNEGKI
jgi:hypothetical protein